MIRFYAFQGLSPEAKKAGKTDILQCCGIHKVQSGLIMREPQSRLGHQAQACKGGSNGVEDISCDDRGQSVEHKINVGRIEEGCCPTGHSASQGDESRSGGRDDSLHSYGMQWLFACSEPLEAARYQVFGRKAYGKMTV